jgi:small-conductance mechanosensitive channel
MKAARPTRIFALLCGLLVAAGVPAQEDEEQAAELPVAPVPSSLQQDWWEYFEGTPQEVEQRIGIFAAQVNEQISGLGAQNQQRAPAIVQAVRDNLQVYLSLLGDVEIQPQELPERAAAYSLDELLQTAATAREARVAANAAESEVEREQRILDGASRRRDTLFRDYLDASAGDERWLAGLRLVRARSAQAISARRLEILTESARFASRYADDTEERLDTVQELLATDADEAALAELGNAVAARTDAVAAAEERAREAQIAASSLDVDSAQGRTEQRLQQQRALDAEVELALATVDLAVAEARRFWTELKTDAEPDLSLVADKSLEWSELTRDVEDQLPDWTRQTEDELLAVQGIDRDRLDRAALRILDQRIGTAQETLGHIGDLEDATADLQLLMRAVDDAIGAYSGGFRQWLSNIERGGRTAWIRVVEFAEMTLFSVGETPVTFGDIVQAFVIFIIGWLLSRGIRLAIRRVGEKESQGTQASLYTLSRLSHYTIIIVAALIALTSIGLDFTNLALVAGALSVGIGFGLQSIVNNFVSGLIILFERTLRVGDYIELDTGLTGTVKAINVRSTLINTNDNIDIVVPNSEFVSTKLTNWTLGEHFLRVRIPFGVAYGSDKELVRKAAIEACEEVPFTLTHMPGREPDVWLVEYGDSSLNFLLLVWVNRQGARRPTRTRAAYLWALENKLTEYGIEIPFPQRDLHLRSGWPPPARDQA